jgi:PEGA domain
MRRNTTIAATILTIIALIAINTDSALAQRRGGGGRPHEQVFIGGYFYDPFFGPYPWWGPGAYPYPYAPVYDRSAQVRLQVTPRDAAVYVDGYYAGIVDDFDGVLQSLALSPGGHEVTVFLDGYKTVHQKLYLVARKTYKVRYALQPVAAGEQSEAPPVAPPVPPPPAGSAMLPRTPRRGVPPLPLPSPSSAGTSAPGAAAAGFGTLALRVQPADAEVLIDGERWTSSQPGERLLVQVPEGRHHVEVQRAGFRTFSSEIAVPRGETTPLNVSLGAL